LHALPSLDEGRKVHDRVKVLARQRFLESFPIGQIGLYEFGPAGHGGSIPGEEGIVDGYGMSGIKQCLGGGGTNVSCSAG